jgi:hypothetical protein
MTNRTLKAIAAAALIGLTALTLSAPAEAGRGYGYGHGRGYGNGYGNGGWGGGWGAGLIGFGVGAIVGSALVAPREVYVVPPPPPPGPAYYGPVSYGPPAWTPDWYTYCAQRYRSFNSRTGYFVGYDGLPYFCQ